MLASDAWERVPDDGGYLFVRQGVNVFVGLFPLCFGHCAPVLRRMYRLDHLLSGPFRQFHFL